MLKDITAVKLLDGFRLHITFEDDVEGTVDIQELVTFAGIFSPLADPEYFSQITVSPELGTNLSKGCEAGQNLKKRRRKSIEDGHQNHASARPRVSV